MFWEQDKNVPSQHSLFTVVLETIGNEIRKGNKKYTDWEGRNKTVFAEDMIIEKNPPQNSKLLELISNYSKVARYKISNIQVSITFLYTSNEQMDFEM